MTASSICLGLLVSTTAYLYTYKRKRDTGQYYMTRDDVLFLRDPDIYGVVLGSYGCSQTVTLGKDRDNIFDRRYYYYHQIHTNWLTHCIPSAALSYYGLRATKNKHVVLVVIASCGFVFSMNNILVRAIALCRTVNVHTGPELADRLVLPIIKNNSMLSTIFKLDELPQYVDNAYLSYMIKE